VGACEGRRRSKDKGQRAEVRFLGHEDPEDSLPRGSRRFFGTITETLRHDNHGDSLPRRSQGFLATKRDFAGAPFRAFLRRVRTYITSRFNPSFKSMELKLISRPARSPVVLR
jgi:hypothetical protein